MQGCALRHTVEAQMLLLFVLLKAHTPAHLDVVTWVEFDILNHKVGPLALHSPSKVT